MPYALYAANAGVPGVAGPQGIQGIQGLKGDTGLSGANGAIVAYKIKVNMAGGGINATTPIEKVWAPGNVEIYDSVKGWSISGWSIVNTSSNLTLTHPLGKPVLMGTTTGINGNNLFTRAIVGTTAGMMSIINTEGNVSVQFTGIVFNNTGCASSGTSYVIITFFVES